MKSIDDATFYRTLRFFSVVVFVSVMFFACEGLLDDPTKEDSDDSDDSEVELSGTIDSDKTFTDRYDDPEKPDYIITDGLEVNAKLTIEEGVLVHFKENAALVVKKEGALVAEGSSDNTIVMTSTDEDAGIHWKGILISSSSSLNSISHTKISHAGKSTFGGFGNYKDKAAAIGLLEDGKLNLTNTTVTNSGGYGVYERYGTLATFTENTFSSNEKADVGISINQSDMIDESSSFGNKIEIFNSTSDEEVSLVQLPEEIPYNVTGDLAIKSEVSINAGVHLHFNENVKIDVKPEGSLQLNGTSSDLVHVTCTDSAADLRWKGILFSSESAKNSISYADISYAGNSNFGGFANYKDKSAVIGLQNNARLEINNTSIRESGGYGMYVRDGKLSSFSSIDFSNNSNAAIGLRAAQASNLDKATTFSNNGWNGAEVFESSIQEECSWVDLKGDATYHIINDITIKTDVETSGLSIDAGATMEFDEDVMLDVQSGAYLSAIGTSDNMVTFTTSNKAGEIYWKGIRFVSANAQNELDYVHINYGGGATHSLSSYEDIKTALSGNKDADITLTNSTVENSENYGVYFQGTINLTNNTFQNNPGGVMTNWNP